MIITLRIIRAFFGLVAGSGAIHFILVISSVFSTVLEEELKILPNALMLIIGLVVFVLIRKLIHYLHHRKHGEQHPKLVNPWQL